MPTKEQIEKELVDKFYRCMPFKDVKLTACEEKPEFVIEMEKLSAKQCALIAQEYNAELIKENKELKEDIQEELNAWRISYEEERKITEHLQAENSKLKEALEKAVDDLIRMIPQLYQLDPLKYSVVADAKALLNPQPKH
jgi:predicted nuclease with TOPRIM domain